MILFVSATWSMSIAQRITETDVPAPVKTSFAKSFPGLSPKWEKDKGNYEAAFIKDGKTMSATFGADGVLTESEISIRESELPSPIVVYVNSNYKNKKIKEAAIITNAGGTSTYEAEVDGKDLIFDSNGKFIKEIKD